MSIEEVLKRINMKIIERIIDEAPFIIEEQKDFYKIMITERKAKIIDYSLELLSQE